MHVRTFFELSSQLVAMAVVTSTLIGCSGSSSSLPAAILEKSRTAQNTYGEAHGEASRTSTPAPLPLTAQPFVVPQEVRTLRQTASFALGRIGPAAIPGLLQLMRSPDPVVKRQAIETISRIGPEATAAVPDLTYALQDPDPLVKKWAARALGQIGPGAADATPALLRVMLEAPE